MKILCAEPGGDVLHEVRQLLPDTKEILDVYDRLGTCNNLFDHRPITTIENLIRDSWKFWLVEDVGILCFDPWISGHAHVHITFWDRRLRGREHLCRTVALSLMHRYNVGTVVTAIPASSRVVAAFAKRVGFRETQIEYQSRKLYVAHACNFIMQKQGD